MEDKTYLDLIDLVDKQGEIIKQQATAISQLISENIEKGTIINELLSN